MKKFKHTLLNILLITTLSTISACDVQLEPPQDVQDTVDILTTLASIDLSQATNLVIGDTPEGIHTLFKEDANGVLIQVNFLDTQNQTVDTNNVFPVAMRLLNSEYLYLVLGSDAFTPTQDQLSNPESSIPGKWYSYQLPPDYVNVFYKKQRHFLVRLTDGAMFHFNASDYYLEINPNNIGGIYPVLYGKYSLRINDNNIYFVGSRFDSNTFTYNNPALFKLDTTDPSNLTATRISFSDDTSIGRYIVNQNSDYIYTALAATGTNHVARYSTPTDTGYVTLTDVSSSNEKRFPSFICPDGTMYMTYDAHSNNAIYTADTTNADVASQTSPTFYTLSPSPWQYTSSTGGVGTYTFDIYNDDVYSYYNIDGTHRSTLTISDEGDVWKLCGSGAPSRLSAGAGTLTKKMTSNLKLYILSSDGISNQLRSFDPVTEADTSITSNCTSCVWTDFRVNGVDDVTLYGSDPGTARTNVIHRIYADGTEEELASETDVSEVYQVERFF